MKQTTKTLLTSVGLGVASSVIAQSTNTNVVEVVNNPATSDLSNLLITFFSALVPYLVGLFTKRPTIKK